MLVLEDILFSAGGLLNFSNRDIHKAVENRYLKKDAAKKEVCVICMHALTHWRVHTQRARVHMYTDTHAHTHTRKYLHMHMLTCA